MTDEEMGALIGAMKGENGDLLLFAADQNKVVWDVLGALRLELARQMELVDKNDYRFLWVTEFPLLEWSEEQNRFVAMHADISEAESNITSLSLSVVSLKFDKRSTFVSSLSSGLSGCFCD